MTNRKDWFRPSRLVTRDKRWPALRLAAKRRDRWKCVSCGAAGPLEVDHVKPVRNNPELSFELSNLQTLCKSCHARKNARGHRTTPRKSGAPEVARPS
ncbi:HNH endonuclease [Methyloceanibacter methanicus]|uniref:HNH endonuclease n=1 Tax=Methyloceanibacter methanicus TaxID=1774968 RepID=UPI003CC79F76